MVNFWDGGGSVHKINTLDMSEVRSLSIHDRFIEPQRSRIERLKIATTIFVRKIDTRWLPTNSHQPRLPVAQ
jgi:CHAT domain-containing protein